MSTLLAFHRDPSVKQKYLNRVADHRVSDQIVQGKTWDDRTQKGCAVGCTLHAYDHKAYEAELGVPRVLARLEDGIFEGMSVADAREWPERFLAAIPVGADLSMIWPRFAHWLLVDQDHGVIRHAKTEKTKKAVADVAALYFRWMHGEKPRRNEWVSAAAYAYAAAAAAAYAYAAAAAYADAAAADAAYAAAAATAYTATAYTAYAAYDAADAAAAYAAAAAAYDAAYAAADAAYAAAKKARQAARKAQADYLVKLLSEAPVAA